MPIQIIRGNVSAEGNHTAGHGFKVLHMSSGKYAVLFNDDIRRTSEQVYELPNGPHPTRGRTGVPLSIDLQHRRAELDYGQISGHFMSDCPMGGRGNSHLRVATRRSGRPVDARAGPSWRVRVGCGLAVWLALAVHRHPP